MNRISATLYDRTMAGVEAAGLAAWRDELLAGLVGRVIEIGAGTGANLDRYPPAVSELVLTEPDPRMRSRLHTRVALHPRRAVVIDAPAEALPYPDGHFDAAVSTLVLCSVADPAAALGELRRVLRPGGSLVLIEHVRARPGTRRSRWQHLIEPAWKRLAGNCHLTRDTASALADAGFDPAGLLTASMRKAPPVIRPTIRGALSVKPRAADTTADAGPGPNPGTGDT